MLLPDNSQSHTWKVRLQGLDTEAPRMVTSSGVRLAGEYEDSLGSLLFFLLQQRCCAGAAGAAPAEEPAPQPAEHAGGGADSACAAGPSGLPQKGDLRQLTLGTLVTI